MTNYALNGRDPFNEAGYEKLAAVLREAYGRSARGKGRERHANGRPFVAQPILEIARMLPGIGGHTYQIMKKAQEAAGMAERGSVQVAQNELLDIIVYAAAAHIRLDELGNAGKYETPKAASLRPTEQDLSSYLAKAIDPSEA